MTKGNDQDARYLEASTEYGASLERLAITMEANPARRHDLLQDMHVALWRSFARFDGRCSLRTWVYRVAHNVAASHVAREKRHHSRQVSDDALADMPGGEDLQSSQERSDALAKLHAWIRGLKPEERQIMTLYLEDLDTQTIAEITGLTPGAVSTRISRLKDRLQHAFREDDHA